MVRIRRTQTLWATLCICNAVKFPAGDSPSCYGMIFCAHVAGSPESGPCYICRASVEVLRIRRFRNKFFASAAGGSKAERPIAVITLQDRDETLDQSLQIRNAYELMMQWICTYSDRLHKCVLGIDYPSICVGLKGA